jgi:hypothetical protein
VLYRCAVRTSPICNGTRAGIRIRTVSVSGTVTQSWGVPFVPFRMYKVDDGTGQVTVLSQSMRTPATGEHVRVKGKVQDVAMFGGRAVGLHIREDSLYVKRGN